MAGLGQGCEEVSLVQCRFGWVEAEFDGRFAGDCAAIRSGSGEGQFVASEEGNEEGGSPASAQDEDIIALHCVLGGLHESGCVEAR